MAIRSAYIRVFLIGLLLQIVLQRFSRGILPEKRPAGLPREPVSAAAAGKVREGT